MMFIKAIIFLLSFYLTIYFFGKLFSWGIHELSNDKKMSNKQIFTACISIFIAGIGWATLYYLSLK